MKRRRSNITHDGRIATKRKITSEISSEILRRIAHKWDQQKIVEYIKEQYVC
jgi:hypothetical protein